MKDFELSEEAVRALTAYAESWDADGMASAVSAFAEKVAPLIDGAIREMGRKWEQFAASNGLPSEWRRWREPRDGAD